MGKLSDYLDNGYLVLIFGLLYESMCGIVYVWGNINIYAVSYLRLYYEPNLLLSDVFLGIPIQTITNGLLMPLSSTVAHKLTPRWAMFLGMSLIVTGFIIMSFSHHHILTMLSFSIFHGVGNAMSFMAPVIAGWAYFPDRKGMAAGVTIAGVGVGGFLYSIAATRIINPENKSGDISVKDGTNTDNFFNADVADNFPYGCRMMCIIFASVTILAMIFVRMPGSRALAKIEGRMKQSKRSNVFSIDSMNPIEREMQLTFKEAICTKTFWYFFISIYGTIFYGMFMASAYKNYAQQYIRDDTYLAFVGGFGFFFNAMARVVFSTAQDKYGFKPVYLILIAIQIVICATVEYAVHSKVLFFITVALSIACEGGHFTIFATVAANVFGPTTGGKAYGVFFQAIGLSSLTGFFANQYLVKPLGYGPIFYVSLGLTVFFGICLLFYKERRIRKIRPLSQFADKASP